MPNWCNNVATLRNNKAMIDKVAGATDGILQALVPCPEDLLIDKGYFADEEKQAALEAQGAANLKKYGYKDWYDWRVANWGTKWDLCDVNVNRVDDETVTLTFDTAWSPPIEAYEKLLGLGFEITAYYYESGMQYAGSWIDGVDDEYSDWGDSKGAVATLPAELDDMFAISENQAMWEEEDKEEVQVWYEDGVEKLKEKV